MIFVVVYNLDYFNNSQTIEIYSSCCSVTRYTFIFMCVYTCQTEEEFFNLTEESQEKELDIEEEDKSDQDEDEQDYEEHVGNSAKKRQKSTSRDNALEKIHSLRNMVQTLQQQGSCIPSGIILRFF